jgi:thiamine pyrophosphate-dependent acetolactate synthase large subunit-like protein
MKRWDAVAALVPLFPDALVVACNGMIGRDLYATGDRPNQFYMIGSMGLASSIGLGLALAQPARRVVVLDGDGNVLMNLGTLANVAATRPANYYHVILDNGTHASTGDQKTISNVVRLEEVARAAGYRQVWRVREAAALEQAAREFLACPGPVCLLVEVEPGNQPKVPRVALEAPQIAARFRAEATR